MTLFLLISTLGCSDSEPKTVSGWDHQRGDAATSVIDPESETPPLSLPCEGSYTVLGSHARMVEDCSVYGSDATENDVCEQAYRSAVQAGDRTRCPEPPPVSCPKSVSESWRGWKCGTTPGVQGTFANCAVHLQLSCSQ